MPTREQIQSTIERIKELSGIAYMEGEEYDVGDQHLPRSGLEPIPFNALTPGDRLEILDMLVDWEGFTDAQRGNVIRRVIDGQDAESWMGGIEPDGSGGAPGLDTERAEALRLLTAVAREFEARLEEHPLHRAARLGDVERIKTFLGRGWEADSRGAGRATALHLAAEAGQTDAARVLLDHDADIEARCWGGRRPLLRAAEHGHTATVGLLIERGADVDAITVNGATALHLAAEGGHVEVAERLIAAGADVNARDHTETRLTGGWAPLHVAMAHGHDELAARLIAAGADRRDEWLGAFGARVFEWLGRDVDSPRPEETASWAEAAAPRKLEMIVRAARLIAERGGAPVPGAYLLHTVEELVDYAGLAPAQREWLEDLRSGPDSGLMHPPDHPGASDPIAEALATIAGTDHPDGPAADVAALPSRAERHAAADSIMEAIRKDGFHGPAEPGRPSRPGAEETPLERAERQIGHIKLVPGPYDFSIEELGPRDTGVSDEWTRLPEAEKLARLARQVDVARLPAEARREFEEKLAAAIGQAADLGKTAMGEPPPLPARSGAAPPRAPDDGFDRLMADIAAVAPGPPGPDHRIEP